MPEPNYHAMQSLMHQLHDSLLQGRIDSVAGKAEEFETIAQSVGQLPLSPDQIRALGQDANALEVLLRAAMEGIRAAHRRFEALQAAHSGLDSYDQRGRSLRIASNSSKTGRRV